MVQMQDQRCLERHGQGSCCVKTQLQVNHNPSLGDICWETFTQRHLLHALAGVMQKGQIHYLGNDFTLVFAFSRLSPGTIFALSVCTYYYLSLFAFMETKSAVKLETEYMWQWPSTPDLLKSEMKKYSNVLTDQVASGCKEALVFQVCKPGKTSLRFWGWGVHWRSCNNHGVTVA